MMVHAPVEFQARVKKTEGDTCDGIEKYPENRQVKNSQSKSYVMCNSYSWREVVCVCVCVTHKCMYANPPLPGRMCRELSGRT